MNTSLRCSANSAFSIPNIDSYDFLSLDRAIPFAHEPMEPFYEPRDAQDFQPSPICLDSCGSFHSSVFNAVPPQNNMSVPIIPFPFLHEFGFETGFIRKRNERERMRVRTVNEGYARLRDHLPLEVSEKRMSKVETLRAAIKYIKYLEEVLDDTSRKEPSRKRRRIERPTSDKRECLEINWQFRDHIHISYWVITAL